MTPTPPHTPGYSSLASQFSISNNHAWVGYGHSLEPHNINIQKRELNDDTSNNKNNA